MKVEAPEEDILRYLEKKTIHKDNPYTAPVLKETVEDSYHGGQLSPSDRAGDRA